MALGTRRGGILGSRRSATTASGSRTHEIARDEQLHSGVNLRLQIVVLLDRHVQLDRVQINDHSSDLRGVLLPNQLVDVPVDGRTNDLLAVLCRGLRELLRVEHLVDLCLIHTSFASISTATRHNDLLLDR
mgnify:FL=1